MNLIIDQKTPTESIGINPIHIRFSTNVGSDSSSILTRNMFHIPKPKKDDESENSEEIDKEDKDSNLSEYPFFTDSVRFPTSKIIHLSKEDQMNLFFNKKIFKKVIGNVSNIDEETRIANAEYNFNALLNILLPTSFPIKNNIYETFSGNIKNLPVINNVEDDIGLFTLFSKLFTDEQNKYSYISLNGNVYTVIKITHINDIINDPVFFNLLNGGKNFQSWRKFKINETKKNIDFLEAKLRTIIKNNLSVIQSELSKKGSDANKTLEKIKDYKIPSNKALVPVALLVPIINDLANEKETNLLGIVNNFIKIYKLKEKSGERSQTFVPIQFESLPGFKELLKSSIDFTVKKNILECLYDINEINKYLDIKKDDDVNDLNAIEKRVYKEIIKYDKITAYLNEVKQYSSPLRIYTNPNLIEILDQIKSNMEEFIHFIEFINSIRIEGEKPKAELLGNLQMIDRLKTGIMAISKDQSGDDKDKDKDKDVLGINSEKFYDTFINLELINGEMNDENIEEIKCPYRDRMLMNMYNDIKYEEQKNPVIFYIDDRPFVISSVKKGGNRKTKRT